MVITEDFTLTHIYASNLSPYWARWIPDAGMSLGGLTLKGHIHWRTEVNSNTYCRLTFSEGSLEGWLSSKERVLEWPGQHKETLSREKKRKESKLASAAFPEDPSLVSREFQVSIKMKNKRKAEVNTGVNDTKELGQSNTMWDSFLFIFETKST